jgi:DNA (cytosine-5)-methyltransferase 1
MDHLHGNQNAGGQIAVAHTLKGEGFDASEDGTGRGTPIIPVAPFTLAIRGRGDSHQLEYRQDGTANAVLTPNGGRAGIGVGAIAFDTTQITSAANYSNPKAGEPCHPLASGAHPPAIAFDAYNQSVSDVSHPLRVGLGNGSGDEIPQTLSNWAVRRLTPTECERLQGFPDNYTNVPWNRKDNAPDGPRYKALGNSMAVNVMRWIGKRIQMVEDVCSGLEAAE